MMRTPSKGRPSRPMIGKGPAPSWHWALYLHLQYIRWYMYLYARNSVQARPIKRKVN